MIQFGGQLAPRVACAGQHISMQLGRAPGFPPKSCQAIALPRATTTLYKTHVYQLVRWLSRYRPLLLQPDDLSSFSGNHVVERGNQQHEVVL